MISDRRFDLLLDTKLHQPQLRSEVVARDRLFEKLSKGLHQRLTLISAPAGYGKTSLVLSWIHQTRIPVVWVSLDEQDNNPVRFFSYLAAAIIRGQSNAAHLDLSQILSVENPSAEDIVLSIQNHVRTCDPFNLVVLDDFHLITDPVILRHLTSLLQHLPNSSEETLVPKTGCHFILTTRTDPQLPLSRWRLNGELSEIRISDLRFTLPEARTVVSRNNRLEISDGDIQILLDKTEGWVASMQLASLILAELPGESQAEVIHQLSGNNFYIADYLAEEVYKQLDEQTRTFLVYTAVLDRISADLAGAVTGMDHCQSILEKVEKNNVFVVPLDSQRGWYRYHQLFRDFLLTKLQEEHGADRHSLLLRAADWYESKGYLEDCLKCLIAAGDYNRAAQAVIEFSPGILSHGQFYILKNILEAFPLEVIQVIPELSIYRAWANLMMKPESVEVWLTLAEQGIKQKGTPSSAQNHMIQALLGEIAAIRAINALRHGDLPAIRELVAVALEMLPYVNPRIRGLVLNITGFSQYCDFLLDEAAATYLSAGDILIRGGNVGGASSESFFRIAEIRFLQGRLHEATIMYQSATDLEDSSSTKSLAMACCSRSGLGRLDYEWNQVDQGIYLLEQGRMESKWMGIAEQLSCDLMLAEIQMNLGNFDYALDLLKEHVERLNHRPPLVVLDRMLKANWIRVTATHNRSDNVLEVIKSSIIPTCHNPMDELEQIIFAQSLYQIRQYDAVTSIASNLIPAMRAGGRNGSLIRILALSAVSYLKLNRKDEALANCTQALKLSGAESFIRTYVDYSEPMQQIIQTIHSRSHSSSVELDQPYIRKLLDVFEEKHYAAQNNRKIQNGSTVEHSGTEFTEQEKKVIRLLVAGQNNREIANILCVSINTIKTHVGNIYEKLGVHNRFQLASCVRELKIKI
jgi:LuxR family transcriptional regulator, maltose regulon positive regulatory protein